MATLKRAFTCAAAVILMTLLSMTTVDAQTDPGPRPTINPGANAVRLPNLNVDQKTFWGGGQNVFKEVFSVSGAISGEPGVGLGPGFNGNACVMCHAQPTVGGSSPATNPQVAVATLDGAANAIPSFITLDGPVREARFILNQNRQPDGGVHNLFTISGRADAPGCNLAQPDFHGQLVQGNVIFRIPAPLFGLGFVENTPDSTLQANLNANVSAKSHLGIAGRFNLSGNDGTIMRFGWKAQNKSLSVFAGEALNVELGVSNENFPNERSAISGCVFNPTPEDNTPATGPDPVGNVAGTTGSATQMASVMENLAVFMRLNAARTPALPPGVTVTSVGNGQAQFSQVGCAFCHSPSLTTAASQFSDLNSTTYSPYSDFALHHMGSNLADGVTQGVAGPDEFRTAPLWGLGERLFFLHDGRTSDLMAAIQAHASPIRQCGSIISSQIFEVNGDFFSPFSPTFFCGSEANAVIATFNALSASNQQDVLNFLRSL